jgi:hypothetical protein
MPHSSEPETRLFAQQSLHSIDTLDATDIIQERIETNDIPYIETYRSLEDAVM